MIKEAFLACALALPLVNVHLSTRKEYQMLVAYAESQGCDLMRLEKGDTARQGWEATPFTFREMKVYLKKSA